MKFLNQFAYGDADFVHDVAPSDEKPTRFDQLLQSKWNEAMTSGHFWYKLDQTGHAEYCLGKYGFVAQLNTKRANERRKPQHVTSICMPFDGSIFNFTKLKEGEMLFSLKECQQSGRQRERSLVLQAEHWVVINVSPVEYCNSLLVPSLYSCLPQVLTPESVHLAIDTVLLSGSPNFRLGFNSLGGHASVNHHHFHVYYLEHRLYIETARVNHLWSECYEILDYPAKGFAFQVTKDNKEAVVRDVMWFRVFLWARKSCYGAKDESAFNVALCELSGHLIMKNEEGYLTATEDSVSQELREFCDDTFAEVRSQVVALNNDCCS
ncbi:hypothetical protein MTO96_023754 [Rhipicephalus appendiculatus]